MNLYTQLPKRKDSVINLSVNKTCALKCVLANAQINNPFQYYGLKLVIRGKAMYRVNSKSYNVGENYYLLTNAQQEGVGIIDSETDVVQFCIHLNPETVSDVYMTLTSKLDPDHHISNNRSSFHFFENIYSVKTDTELSKQLYPLTQKIKAGRKVNLDDEWILEFAEKIVLQNLNIQSALNRLDGVKLSTRNEIMKRLLLAKEYIDTYYTSDPMIPEIAKCSLMSEFFFFRAFKKAFHTTPYQYILDRKIERAKELMEHRNLNLSEIAVTSGFPDMDTFSKAFKRKYGISPSFAK